MCVVSAEVGEAEGEVIGEVMVDEFVRSEVRFADSIDSDGNVAGNDSQTGSR